MLRSRWFRLLLLVNALLMAGVGYFCWENATRPERLRAEAVRTLAAASSAEELKTAAGRGGAVMLLADGSWIAIRYHSSHESMFFHVDCAVALDSEGQWYLSRDTHYCGHFEGLGGVAERKRRKEQAQNAVGQQAIPDANPPPPRSEPHVWSPYLIALENSADLTEARRYLPGAGFVPMNEPTRPAFTGKWPVKP